MRPIDDGLHLVTGAAGQIGRELCRTLKDSGAQVVAADVKSDRTAGIVECDLRRKRDIARLFRAHPVRTVFHLAAVLPTAFREDPLNGAAVNLSGSIELLREAVNARVKRFVFASSLSVYGSSPSGRPLTERDAAAPDEPYGASKRAVELVGEVLHNSGAIEFAALRIARVVGPGVRTSSSPWRSQIFEPGGRRAISIPFTPGAKLSLVHVEDVARMLLALAGAPALHGCVYNTPVEIWEARRLKDSVETARGVRVELTGDQVHGGPTCDGTRFIREFRFKPRGVRHYLRDSTLL